MERRLRSTQVVFPLIALAVVGWIVANAYVATRDSPGDGVDVAMPRPPLVVGKSVTTNATRRTSRKKKKKKGKKRRHRRKPTPAPTAAPTTQVPEAVAFPFNRPERTSPRAGEKVRRKAKNVGLRRFRVGPRKDLENFVAPLVRKLGLLETREMDWDVYVGLQFKPEYEKNYALAPNGSLMSSIPGLKETVGDKEALSRLWRACVARADAAGIDVDALCGWTTPSFNLVHKMVNGTPALAVEGGAEALVAAVKRHATLPSTWIVKPQRRFLSLGMHLATIGARDLESLDALAAWASREVPVQEKKRKHHTKQPGEFTIQRYVDVPGLVGPRKFDLRLWAFVASLHPLEVYLLDVAFPKISVVDYVDGLPANTSTLAEKCMHILMMVSEFCIKRVAFPNPFPFKRVLLLIALSSSHSSSSAATGRSFFEELRASRRRRRDVGLEETWHRWQVEHWPELERLVLWPLLLARAELETHEARIFGAVDNDASRRYRRVALLSPDAIWDAEAGAWRLEEINTNGLFQLGADDASVKTFHYDEGYTEGWLRIAGVDGFPNAPAYAEKLRNRLDKFCETRGCSAHDRNVLERAGHQNAHASGGWYRIFPPVDCGSTCGPRRQPDIADDPIFKTIFKPELTELAQKHWDFLRDLDRTYFAVPPDRRREEEELRLPPRSRRHPEYSRLFPRYIVDE
ncbi:hypothetical protein CTAYLR_005711 [Chrysophaeum taylorii]|uniref:Tubulin--tyrosine ligase-like protein 5 n=1 Tax=Chrysophaeum taylorii TaxID=2483200 RepID=A0AAD7UL81_9STRA|nr:hypothetical protein CTAYLR_005711 [Chrysophaeum taylorii]